jgi:hypothetical protein
MDHLVDLIVRFGERLDDRGRHRIETALRGLGGVAAVDFSHYSPRLAFVVYHPGRVLPVQIIQHAKAASQVDAELVGLSPSTAPGKAGMPKSPNTA